MITSHLMGSWAHGGLEMTRTDHVAFTLDRECVRCDSFQAAHGTVT